MSQETLVYVLLTSSVLLILVGVLIYELGLAHGELRALRRLATEGSNHEAELEAANARQQPSVE
jgi:hypothetical protein